MTDYAKWYPGPDEGTEISSLGTLKSAIKDRFFGDLVRGPTGFPDAAPGEYVASVMNYSWNSGMPYFSIFHSGAPDSIVHKIRFSAALVGTLDPLTWLPDVFSTVANNSQADIERTGGATGVASLVDECFDSLDASNLSRSPITGSAATLHYTHGARSGQGWGVNVYSDYTPNLAEQDDGITGSFHAGFYGGTDADDGTIGVTVAPLQAGENYSITPQVVATTQDAGASWGELGDAVDVLKPAIDNNTKELQDVEKELKNTAAPGRPDTVTHIDDVGATGDTSAPTPVPILTMFGTAGALPALVSGTTAIALLSKVPSILVASAAAVGTMAATVMGLGWLPALKDAAVTALNWTNSLQNTADAVTMGADAMEDVVLVLERIADSLEALEGEIVRDPEEPITKPGLVNVVELASQARAEIEVQTHGTRFTASTGTAIEV